MIARAELPKDFPDVNVLMANAVSYLIQGEEKETARLLLACSARLLVSVYDEHDAAPDRRGEIRLELTGPRGAYEMFNQEGTAQEQLWGAFEAVKPIGFFLRAITTRVETVSAVSKDWRHELEVELEGKTASNQGVQIQNHELFHWNGLRFRSPHEVQIAAALDTLGVLFLPNCRARLGPRDNPAAPPGVPPNRVTREADFLVCHKGKWGVLEVDGSQHVGSAADDHERDRLFQHHGIRVTQRYKAKECMADAPKVVRSFLTLLEQNG